MVGTILLKFDIVSFETIIIKGTFYSKIPTREKLLPQSDTCGQQLLVYIFMYTQEQIKVNIITWTPCGARRRGGGAARAAAPPPTATRRETTTTFDLMRKTTLL